ncbi:MAG: TRAFAC clade GTPase domain-containing protein [Capsulimonadaceae bacterium]
MENDPDLRRSLEDVLSSSNINTKANTNQFSQLPLSEVIGDQQLRVARQAIPAASNRVRSSPRLDPKARKLRADQAKWVLLICLVLLATWVPSAIPSHHGNHNVRDIVTVAISVLLATVIATALPRIALPRLFGRWREAVEAFRDWLVVSVITGSLYAVVIATLKRLTPETSKWHDPLPVGNPALFDQSWVTYRLGIMVSCSVAGILIARAWTKKHPAWAVVQVLAQACIVGVMSRLFEFALNTFQQQPILQHVLLVVSICGLLFSCYVVIWAFNADRRLVLLHQRRNADTGIVTDSRPVPLTLTVVGGPASGKTAFLAAAYYEWTMKNPGQLTIKPASSMRYTHSESSGAGTNLETIATRLYAHNLFPGGNVDSSNLDFELLLRQQEIAQFSILDYPGGAFAGTFTDRVLLDEFWQRVENTDGIILIADMSWARRGSRDKDFLALHRTYKELMNRVIKSNGSGRVVPIALVLTKCDEWMNTDTNSFDLDGLDAALTTFHYRDLEAHWREISRPPDGPGVVEFTKWISTAITSSRPHVNPETQESDLNWPFDPVPPITPTGCASPLLWTTAKVIRWNGTMFYDIKSFFLGASIGQRKRAEALDELELIADRDGLTGWGAEE